MKESLERLGIPQVNTRVWLDTLKFTLRRKEDSPRDTHDRVFSYLKMKKEMNQVNGDK